MGKGGPLAFLNKKPWHPSRPQNLEEVWKREQNAAEEQKKLEEIRLQYEEERKNQEFMELARAAGRGPAPERLDWMYAGSMAAKEDAAKRQEAALLGQKTAQLAPETQTDQSMCETASKLTTLTSGATPASQNEQWQRLNNDPLLMIKRQQQEALKKVRDNPIKMQEILKQVREQAAASGHKEKKHKKDKKHKKEKKHKKDKGSGGGSSSGSEDERHGRGGPGVGGGGGGRPGEAGGRRDEQQHWDSRGGGTAGRVMEDRGRGREWDARGEGGGRQGEKDRGRDWGNGGREGRDGDRGRERDGGRDGREDRERAQGREREREGDRGRDGYGDREREGDRDRRDDRNGDRERERDRDRRDDRNGDRDKDVGRDRVRERSPALVANDRSRSHQEDDHKHGGGDRGRGGDVGAGGSGKGGGGGGGGLPGYGLTKSAAAPEGVKLYDASKRAEETRERLREAARKKEQEEREKAAVRYQKQAHQTGKMSEEERARRLAEMTSNAQQHDAARLNRLSRAAQAEADQDKQGGIVSNADGVAGAARQGDAFSAAASRDVFGALSGASIEARVSSRKHYAQR